MADGDEEVGAHGVEEMVTQNGIVARSDSGTDFYLYSHQAGGHKPFLRSAHGEVCKPAIPLELKFYESIEHSYPQLKPFLPPFLRKVTVRLHQDPRESNSNVASSAPAALSNEINDAARLKMKKDGSPNSNNFGKKRKLVIPLLPHVDSPSASTTSSYSAKLWKMHGGISRANSTGAFKGDLTHDYMRPCVLDIKMGTRQHGEDAPPAKVRSHSAKCAATTSLALGLRLCGMQIYHQSDDRYILYDKHWGRQLAVDTIEPALETYLSDGSNVRWGILVTLVNKIQELYNAIEQTRGLRFWGSSLLIIYEGAERHAPSSHGDARLIDFAHCQMSATLDSPDEGLLLGLQNLIKFFSNILMRRPTELAQV